MAGKQRSAVKKKKLDRKVDLQIRESKLVDLPPGWEFSIPTERFGSLTFDFNPFRENGREDLAMQFRDALWALRRRSGKSLGNYFDNGIVHFWRFLDCLETDGSPVTRLDQIDLRLLNLYIDWLNQQVVVQGKRRGDLWKKSSRKSVYDRIKTLLVNRRKHVPQAVSPDLEFPMNPFRHIARSQAEPAHYSDTEHDRIMQAVHEDLDHFHTGKWEEPEHQVLAMHLLSLALLSGRNPQPLLELKRGDKSVRESAIPGRVVLITEKYRGYKTHVTAYEKALEPDYFDSLVPADLEGHFESLSQHTEHLMEDARPDDRECVFLYRMCKGKLKGQVVRWDARASRDALRAFVKRHDLRDDQDKPLALSISRIRVTFGTQLYEKTRDLLQTSRALGHSSVEITSRRYVAKTPEAERNFSIVVRAMPDWATSKNKKKARELSKELSIPLEQARTLLEGGFNNLTARCSTPFERDGKKCEGWWSCLKGEGCPSAVVFEDDLYRIYSMIYCLLNLRARYGEYVWMMLYADIINMVDNAIAPQFKAEIVEAAKKKARENPHPAWKNLPECSI